MEITEIAPRESTHDSRFISLPLHFFEMNKEIDWMLSYHVHKDDTAQAKELNIKLYTLLEDQCLSVECSPVKEVLAQLYDLREPPYHELLPREKWDRTAKSMPGDIAGYCKQDLTDFLSRLVRGDVLEAFCGFNSYINPNPEIHVIAQDYSKGMLLRYEYPERTRILFDVNTLPDERMPFSDQSFDFIVFVKAYKYINNPETVFREWYRILRKTGKLIFVESSTAGYGDMTVRTLDTTVCQDEVLQSGFASCKVSELDFETAPEEKLFFFEAIKE
jgi:SAM-dependent methyltransferase